MLSFSLDQRAVDVALGELPPLVLAAVETKMYVVTIELQRHVMDDKLEGQVLRHRTGKLKNSIQQEVATQGDVVTGRVFSAGNLPYASIQEFGGTTAPHDILPTKADALAFTIGGAQVFAKVVHHPGSKIPERSYLRSALADQRAEIVDDLRGAAVKAAQDRLK